MKKRVNYYKVVALVLMVVEIYIAFSVDKELVRNNINAWRLYSMCVYFIPINAMIIGTKRTIKGGKNEKSNR